MYLGKLGSVHIKKYKLTKEKKKLKQKNETDKNTI